MPLLVRHVACACLGRAAGLAAVAAALGALIGYVEEANRAASGAASSEFAALARVPEVVFFAAPFIVLLAVLWTARDVVPPAVAEGLGGAGVPPRRVDGALAAAALLVACLAALLGGWLAPVVQRAAVEPAAAWARSGGAPAEASRSGVWVRSFGRLVRVERAGRTVCAAATVARTGDGGLAIVDAPADPGVPLPSPRELDLLAAPPAFLTLPELLAARSVRARFGHLVAPVAAEIALRVALLALVFPAAAGALACRRIRGVARRWTLVAVLICSGLLGLQTTSVWAARGELPVAAVVLAPLALASLAAGAAWVTASRE